MTRTTPVTVAAHPAVAVPVDHAPESAQREPAAVESSTTARPQRTLGELTGGSPGAPSGPAPRRAAPERGTSGSTASFASKLKGRAQRFMQKRLVSTTTSAVVVSGTQAGKPTTLPARGNTRIEPHADMPAPDTRAPDAPPPLSASRERRLARVMKQTFDPAASPGSAVRNDIRHALGMKASHDAARLDAMGSATGFERWLDARFGDGPDTRALRAALAQPFGAHDMRVPDALPFAPHALLADALAQAAHAQPARAQAALAALRRGAFLPASAIGDATDAEVFHDARDRFDELDDEFEDAVGDTAPYDAPLPIPPASPDTAAPLDDTPQARADAFAVAQILADSGAGFDALAALLPPLSTPRRDALRDVLSAAAQIADERGAPADLADTLQHAALAAAHPTRDTLACQALRASHAQLAGDATLSRADRAALFAWRQGFRSDTRHDMLSRTRERLAKFRKYVSRAESRDRMTRTAFDSSEPVASSLRVAGNAARRAKHVVQRAFGAKKSPFLAAGRYGTMGAHLKHPDDDQARLDTHLTQAIDLLRTHLEETHPLQPTDAADVLTGRAPAALVRIAVLAHWAERSETARPYGQTLDAQSLVDIAARIDALAGVPPRFPASSAAAGRPHAMPPLPPAVAALAGMKLTDATLAAWAADSALPMQAAGDAGEERTESAFAGALRQARAILHPLDVKPENLSPDALKTFLKQYIADHNGGNAVSFTDGGVAGADAGALSINIALAVTHAGALLLPIIDVGASRGRTATVSIATGAEGGEIFIGTQSAHEGHVGGGVFIGAGYGAKHAKHFNALVGGAASATGRVEHAKPTGVRLRFVPPKNADGKPDYAAMRTKMSEVVDYLFEMSAPAQRELSANALWEHFANRYFDDRELSVSWVDHRRATASLGTAVTGIARIGGKSNGGQTSRVGGSLTYGAQWAATLAKRDDATGAHPQVRRSEGTSHMQTLTSTANMTVPSVDAPGTGAADTPDSLSFPSIPFASATFALHESGLDAAFSAMLEHGRFSESNTFIDLTEHNAGSFVRFASEPAHRAQWERVCTALEDGDADRGRVRLDKLLDDAKRGERPNQGFYIRYRLKQDVLRMLDQYAAAAKQAARRPDGADELAALRRASYALVRRPDVRVPQSLAVYEEVSARRSAGVNFGLQVQAQMSASGAREVSLVDLPLDVANRWAQPAPLGAND
ncbi:hypothetical protein WS90_25140 [Burkholderia cepacia]|uniref:Awr type III effector family protein n=1 Tax=Burkholderia cepacia TaxID=292 RepID=A0A118KEK1_BURCE|nr:hypothetical protein [Burkholderia cepacia]KVK75934.1 hypothetical protein WS90_25140 [Burkholderia cepacia]